MSGYSYFSNNLKDRKVHIGSYDNLQNLFLINDNNFQRKPELAATTYILQ